MPSSNRLDARIVGAAIAEAVSGAQWDRVDLETRRPGPAADELMLAKAAELAMSPLARDQLMSLALEHGAQHFHPDYPVIEVDCESEAREAVAQRIFALGADKALETDAVVATVEERHSRRLCQDARFDLLADGLRQEAVLQEAFWDHPDIPADDAVRLTMLCSVPRLRDRAETLSSAARVWRVPVLRWFSNLKGGVR